MNIDVAARALRYAAGDLRNGYSRDGALGESMNVLLIVGIIAVPLLLWSIISPRSQWQMLSGWAYRNREANEPSDAAYTVARLGSVVALVALLVAGYQLSDLDDERAAWDDLSKALPSVGTGSTVLNVRQVNGSVEAVPMEVSEYVAVSDETSYVQSPPDDIGRIPESTDLLIAVPLNPDFKPTEVGVDETASKVTVTVAGDCNPPDVPGVNPYTFNCADMPGDPLAAYLVPVDLDGPFGNREFIDGAQRS